MPITHFLLRVAESCESHRYEFGNLKSERKSIEPILHQVIRTKRFSSATFDRDV